MAKQSSSTLSSIASRVLGGARATQREIMQLAASVLGQDETGGGRKAKKRKAKKRKAKRKATTKKAKAKKRK